MLDRGRAVAAIAEDLGLDEATVYRHAQTYRLKGLAGYLAAEQPGYWGLLTSAQLAGLTQELGQTLYPDCRAIANWLAERYGVRYSVSGLTDLLHRLGFSCKLPTAVPCEANAAAQTAFLTERTALVAEVTRGEAVLYYADAARPTHNTRCTRAW